MAKTLKELQKKLYAEEEKAAKLRARERELRQKIEIAQTEGRLEKNIEDLKKQAAEAARAVADYPKRRQVIENRLESRTRLLQEHIRHNQNISAKIDRLLADNPDKLQTLLDATPKSLSKAAQEAKKAALKEISKATEEMAEHKAFQEQEKQKHEKLYMEQKAKMFNSLSRVLEDPEGLRDILKPLAAKDNSKKAEGIGGLAKLKAAAEGVVFAASKAGVLIDLIGSREFYAAEAGRAARVLNQDESYDPQNPPFFMRLLQDNETRDFLTEQSAKVIYLVEVLAPLIAPIVLKELGKVDAIAEEVKNKAKALAALPTKEAELENLKKEDAAKHRKRIAELEKEITPLKELQNRERIAGAIDKLKKQGLGDEFITQQLLPVVVETFRELLKQPGDLIDIAGAAMDFVRASEQSEKKAALQKIFDKIDIGRLLQNNKLSEFLKSQGAALTEVIFVAIDAAPEVSAMMAETGVSGETVAGAVQAFAPIAGELLKAPDAEIMGKLKGAIADIALSDLEEQKRKAESPEDLARLDKAQGAQKLGVAKLLPELLLKGDIASLALRNIPEFLRKNQAVMEQVLPKIWPAIVAKIEEGLEKSLLQYNPNLDKAAAKKIILPPLELLKVVDPALLQKLVPVITGFIEGLTDDVSQADLQALYRNVALLNSETTAPKDRAYAQAQLTASALKLMSSEKMTSALRTFGEFLSNEENIPAITAIAVKATEENPILEGNLAAYLHENKQDLAKVATDAVPALEPFAKLIPSALEIAAGALQVATEGAAALLSKSDLIAKIAGDFSTYQMRGRQLKEGGLRHEVQLEFMESRRNLFDRLVHRSLDLANSEAAVSLLQNDIPKFLRDNGDKIKELAVKVTENPEINRLNASPELAGDAVLLATGAAAALLSDPRELTKLAEEVYELMTAQSRDRPQKVTAVVNSVLALKENIKGLNDLIDKEVPKLLTEHAEELGKIVDTFLKQTEAGKALNSRGKQIVEVAGKKLPEVKELAESYAEGNRVSLIPKALKLLFNKEVLGLVVNVAGDMVRNAWQRRMGMGNKSARDNDEVNKAEEKTNKSVMQLPAQDRKWIKGVAEEWKARGAVMPNEPHHKRSRVVIGQRERPKGAPIRYS